MSDLGAGRVLIVSSPRSGSTWTLRALSSAEGASFVREPDNVDTAASVNASVTRLGFGPYPVLEAGEAAPQYAALWDLAFQGRRALRLRRGWGRRATRAVFRLPRPVRDPLLALAARGLGAVAPRRSHVVVSSVMAHFSVEWIHARFRPQIVVLQRDPLNIASSWLRLNVDAYDVHTRPAIVDRHLRPLGVEPPSRGASNVTLVGWWIGALATQLGALLERHPDWILATHEDLCEAADVRFGDLYKRLDLTWTAETDTYLREGGYIQPLFRGGENTFTTSAGGAAEATRVRREQVDAWRTRLTPDQQSELRAVLDTFPNRGWVRPRAATAEQPLQ
jgi:Sulfotransferase domain